ncbi:MAG: hypothetical protein KGL10_01185 [Alphaproteobacteria bacterium]|nr:hypothetical protein [Alphaproteobacteria bacterium]MDE2335902.1 hypothetical protein [Alphaproteobacteria bacterium]
MNRSRHDIDAERLILVGPLQKNVLRPVLLSPLRLAGVPQVAVDGGGAFAFKPVLWAGDGDSGRPPKSVPVAFKKKQDLTDLRFCLEAIRSGDWRELHVFGFLDARKDHELANFGEIYAFLKKRRKPSCTVLYDAKNRPCIRFFQAGRHRVALRGTFSVFVLEPAKITIKGKCRYPADNLSLPPLSGRGVSNVASGEVQIACSKPFFVIG